MKTERVFIIKELPEVVAELLPFLPWGSLVGFSGDLGAGKTTLIREIVSQLKSPVAASSPTYVLEHVYPTKEGEIHHWDLYRIAAAPVELFESIGSHSLTLVEWPERDEELSSQLDLLVTLQLLDENTRKITVETHR